jgi:hypothetical protein
MPSIINATTTNGVVTSGDNSGALVIATNNNVAAITIGTNQVATFAQQPAGTFAGTGPAFRAYRTTSNQSLTANTWSKLQFNAEDFDTASAFDSTTNYSFTPQVAGYYQINLGIQFLGTSIVAVAIYKNGSFYGIGTYFETALQNSGTNSQDLVYLNGSTDYVEGYAIAISSGITVNGTITNQAQSRMSGFLARAA